jgi:hypothetical protein
VSKIKGVAEDYRCNIRPDDPGPGGEGGSPPRDGGPPGPGPADDEDFDNEFLTAPLADDILARARAATRATRDAGRPQGRGGAVENTLSDPFDGPTLTAQLEQLREFNMRQPDLHAQRPVIPQRQVPPPETLFGTHPPDFSVFARHTAPGVPLARTEDPARSHMQPQPTTRVSPSLRHSDLAESETGRHVLRHGAPVGVPASGVTGRHNAWGDIYRPPLVPRPSTDQGVPGAFPGTRQAPSAPEGSL